MRREAAMSRVKSMSRKRFRFQWRDNPRAAVAVALTLCLVGAGLVVGGGLGLKRGTPANHPAGSPSTTQTTPALYREYIYAGSRMIAIEEGAAAGSLAAPSGVEASGGNGAQVSVSWEATAGADHYQVERISRVSPESSTTASSNVAAGGAVINFTDTVPPGTAYLYRVRAADAAGNLSPPSNVDLATAVAFTDEPLQGRTATTAGTVIKAEHLRQLRQAVNAVRALAGLPDASWTHPDPASDPAQRRNIFIADVLELRSNLDAALSILGLQRPYETDPTLSGGLVKAPHFQEIRDRVK